MDVRDKVYINGQWVASSGRAHSTWSIRRAKRSSPPSPRDRRRRRPRRAGAAAAFPAWSATARDERAKFLNRISEGLAARTDEIAATISHEVGMPMSLSG